MNKIKINNYGVYTGSGDDNFPGKYPLILRMLFNFFSALKPDIANCRKRVLSLIFGLILICVASFDYILVFWQVIVAADNEDNGIIAVGEWRVADPNINRFNELIALLLNSDPLLRLQSDAPHLNPYNTLYILGAESYNNSPTLPEWFSGFEKGDVIVWQRQNGTTAAAQVTGDISPLITESWEALDFALDDRNTPLTGSHNRIYNDSFVYTTTHAPVTYKGIQYLARHNAVQSTPTLNDGWREDWFEINDSWLNQFYPSGSFVQYGNSHYIKISGGDVFSPSEPADTAFWKEINEYSGSRSIPLWESGRQWRLNEVVEYGGKYYVCTAEYTTETPDLSNQWYEVPAYSSYDRVPVWQTGNYQTDSFVFYDGNYYIRADNGNDGALPSEDNSPWLRVVSWEEGIGVAKYLLGNSYPSSYSGQFVEHQDLIYRHLGRNANKNTSIADTSYWEPIPKWNEVDPNNPPRIVATLVGGYYIVWELNGDRDNPDEPITEPSELTDSWARYNIRCNDRYVYTDYEGRIMLWRLRDGVSGIYNAPGTTSDWIKLNYKTGTNYVYTPDSLGVVDFWYSSSQSQEPPGMMSGDWVLLNSSNEITAGEYYYIKTDRVYYYKAVEAGDSTITVELSNAWMGIGDIMLYHWSAKNNYQTGDIVVYGITGTNTYRYYRLKENAYSGGAEPDSPTGQLFWEPLNCFKPSN